MVHTDTLHCECPVFMGAQSNVYLLKQAWGSVGAFCQPCMQPTAFGHASFHL